MEEQEEVKQFSLLALPWLAINLVIRLMETWEHVRLSLTSNKMENTIKRVNIKYRSHTCHIRDRSSGISIGIAHMSVFCGTRPTFTGEHCLTRKELSRWWGPKDTTDFKKLMKVLEKIIYIFPCNHLVFCFYQEKMIRTRIRTVLSHPMFQKCDLLGVVEGKITAKEMNYILDAFTSNETESRHLKLEDIQLPYGYFHEKIFQFGGCTYYSADWITIETLLTIKNCYDLEIGENWLTYADMNRFLKYWAQSEVDMFDDYLNIKMEEDIPEHELFDGITRLNSSRFRSPTYFVMANLAQNQRERQMLVIWYEENKLKLTAWSPEDNCQDTDGKDVSYQKEFDALKDVEKRKELKKKLEENSPDEEIKKEIRELDEKLLEFEVRGEFSIIESV